MNRYLVHKDIYNDILLKSFGLDAESIEKARGLPDGTIREWNGKKYKKIRGKWIPLAKGRKAREKEAIKTKGSKATGPEKTTSKAEEKTYTFTKLGHVYNVPATSPEEAVKKLASRGVKGFKPEDASDDSKPRSKEETKTSTSGAKEIPIVTIADNYNKDQEVEFRYGGNTLRGKVVSKGSEGVRVEDKDGVPYKVNYNAITKITQNSDGTIPAGSFNATDYKKAFWDDKAINTPEGIQHIYDSLGAEGEEVKGKAQEIMNKLEKRMVEFGSSIEQYTLDPEKTIYTKERQELHKQIIDSFLTDEKIKNAKPAPGEKPKLVMFGGRGGSGKSWFSNDRKAENGWNIKFDENKFIKLDSDEIKNMLRPPYEGWNAGEVHLESDYLKRVIQQKAQEQGLNIIIDGTMSYYAKGESNWIREEMIEFKNSGYSLEAHYMFVPVQTSTKRAIDRFANKDMDEDSPTKGKNRYNGRFVPVNILLGMQDNEKTFDSVKDICDDWSFSDNQGSEPKLISRKEL